jgi:hypothetical protein
MPTSVFHVAAGRSSWNCSLSFDHIINFKQLHTQKNHDLHNMAF